MGQSFQNLNRICDILELKGYPSCPGPDFKDIVQFRALYLSPAMSEMSEECVSVKGRRYSGAVEHTMKDEFLLRAEGDDDQSRAKKRVLVTTGPLTNDTFWRLENQGEELLPGLPNEVVLDQIVPKLPWRVFHILSSVSHFWQQAIRSHQVYDARVRSNSTETLLVLNNSLPDENSNQIDIHGICLYSVRDETWHQLPHFPNSDRGIPRNSRCIVLDGKIYLFGGETEKKDSGSRDVYALDLAGQREWEQCASMLETRADFGCGTMNGRIYVVGFSSEKRLFGCEVYDPKENTWSDITPMKMVGFDRHVGRIGEELFLQGGQLAYHSGKDEWRLVETLQAETLFTAQGRRTQRLFTAQGKLHSMTSFGIYVHGSDTDKRLWTKRCSFSFAESEPTQFVDIGPAATPCVINDELLALVDWYIDCTDDYKICLLRSKGFCSKDKKMVFEKLYCSLEELGSPCGTAFMCPIEL